MMMMKRLLLVFLLVLPAFAHSQLNTTNAIHTGRSRLYFGNYTGAIESFNMVIKIKPYLPEPYFYRGVAKMNLEDYRGALTDLEKAIEIKPFYPDAFLYRGMVHYHLKEYEMAMNDYSQAMHLDGENADIYNNRGICKAAMRDFEGAIADYTKSIELKPKNFNAHLNRSIAYQIQGEWDKAIADCNELIRIRPNSPMGYMSRGLIKIEKEDFAGALRDFDMAIYHDPKNAFAYQNRGLVKQQLESLDAAIMDYTTALEIDNKMASAYFNRGIAREMTNKPGYQSDYDMASLLDPRFEKRPWQTPEEREQEQLKQMKAMQQQASGITKNTEEPATEASEEENSTELTIDLEALRKRKMKANLVVEDNRDIPGNEPEETGMVQNQNFCISLSPFFEVAVINKNNADNENVGYFSMAIENLNAANNYQPYLTLTNKSLKSISTLQDYQNQKLAFDERIKQNPAYSNNYLYRGIFKSLTQDYQGAIADFDKAIDMDERNLLAYFMRANTKAKMIEAIETIANESAPALNNHSNEPFTLKDKSMSSENKAFDDILTDYSVVLYMNPAFAFGYYNRGNIYCKNEQYLAALDEYDRAIQVEPEFAEAYYNRGLVRILLNDVEGGAKDLSRAGELGIAESYHVIKRYCNQ
ncbi:MAG: tetratricopeptide repeat protein [Prolixibacteraceae bacterium]|nr:tetratricopeptide repeat protein [Prolixibacteraceae bacterium]